MNLCFSDWMGSAECEPPVSMWDMNIIGVVGEEDDLEMCLRLVEVDMTWLVLF